MQGVAGANCIDLDQAVRPASPIRNGSCSIPAFPIRSCSSPNASGFAVAVAAKVTFRGPARSPQLALRPGGCRRRYDD